MAALRWVGEKWPVAERQGEVEELDLVAEMELVVGCYGVVGAALAWLPCRWKARLCQRVLQ
jgi:hypothetical protein